MWFMLTLEKQSKCAMIYDEYSESAESAESAEDKVTFMFYARLQKLYWWICLDLSHRFTEEELDGSSHTGEITTYGGGGYVQKLHYLKKETKKIMQELKSEIWLMDGPRNQKPDLLS